MRGSTPLDVAAASVMDNNELALALEEPDLEKVISCYLSFSSAFLVPPSDIVISNDFYYSYC